ncbi:MAG: N-acetylmuramoyl-L-alanine amidase [Peptococcaceae bacterium]
MPFQLQAQERVGTVTGDVVNIRQGPDTSYPAVNQVKEGQEVFITGEQNNWLQISLADGTTGWLASWLVKETQILKTAVVTGDIVNIRQGAGTNYAAAGQVKAGENLTILSGQNDWYLVKLANGTQGWIANWLVRVEGETGLQSGYITGDAVNIRQNAGTEFPALFQLKKGDQVVVREKNADWYLIDSPQGSGWVASWLLTVNGVQVSRGGGGNSGTQLTGDLVGKTIVIDPGHGSIQPGGWSDPGAIGKILGIKERDVNLEVALQVQQLLSQQGARVIMTHTTSSTYLSLAGRADIANSSNADIFVSIHANSNHNSAYSGTSVYYYAPSSNSLLFAQRGQRQALASFVQEETVKSGGRKNLGIMESNLAVLRETRVPSILVEMAFLSNAEEERLMNTRDFQSRIAWGIYKGIEKYFTN